jgi:hypothetical protein
MEGRLTTEQSITFGKIADSRGAFKPISSGEGWDVIVVLLRNARFGCGDICAKTLVPVVSFEN